MVIEHPLQRSNQQNAVKMTSDSLRCYSLLFACRHFFWSGTSHYRSCRAARDRVPVTGFLLSIFFAGISGSATADAASQSKIFLDAQKKEGYDDSFSVSFTAVSAVHCTRKWGSVSTCQRHQQPPFSTPSSPQIVS